MFRVIVILMIVIPALEIWGLIEVGRRLGAWPTFGLILLTGFIGAWLAKAEGRRVWTEAQAQLASGQVPGRAVLDGLCIFTGGLLLITPGFLSDITGFLLVFPPTRRLFRAWILRFLQKKIDSGSFRIHIR